MLDHYQNIILPKNCKMEPKRFNLNAFLSTEFAYLLWKAFKIFFYIISIIIITVSLIRCEAKEKYYRPNLPEKLCSIGIIDADDSSSYISFEKSIQPEHQEEESNRLKNLSFSISSNANDLFTYQSSLTTSNMLRFKLPEDLEFQSGETYYMKAKENNSPDISAAIDVPSRPPSINLISVQRELINITPPQECTGLTTIKNVTIMISFNANLKKQYYALLISGFGYSYSSSVLPPVRSYIDFTIRDCNAPGFFAEMHGLKVKHWICNRNRVYFSDKQALPYFIDGDKIPNGICRIGLSFKFQDTYSLIDILKSIQLKLLSVPEELFLFEKSLYTYIKIKDDPFSEPVYLEGNVRGGNGIFAICRSTKVIYELSSPPYF